MYKISEYQPYIFNWNISNENKLNYVKEQTENALKFYGLKNWNVGFDTAKTRLGRCSYTKKLISLSEFYVVNNSFDDIQNTILHEIAHALSFLVFKERGHGHIWKSLAIQIGCSGERCRKADEINLPTAKYVYKCPNCDYKINKYRKTTKIKACGVCCDKYNNGKFTKDYAFILINQ
jgi:predicted SprT family Zn-dependent metalloprotease